MNKKKKKLKERVGTKKVRWWDWHFPFQHEIEMDFGGKCAICGKWFWEWKPVERDFVGICGECAQKRMKEMTENMSKSASKAMDRAALEYYKATKKGKT